MYLCKRVCELFMKLFITISIMSVLWLALPIKSYSYNVAKNICEYVAVDDKSRLRKLLKANRLKLRNVFNDVSCDNDNILLFAAKKNAENIGQLLIKKLPKAVIADELGQLEKLSPPLANIAKTRIN